jgi:pimeloyl-ACP methyl ester carboxylesterase
LAPLSAEQPLTRWPVAGFGDAVLSLPRGATKPVPVYVALHGNFDKPEWQCSVWREVLGDSAFVLCPRGVRRADVAKSLDRWTYAAFARTEAEVLAALEVLERIHAPHVDSSRVALIGFSLGAAHAARLLEKHGARFRRAILIEGGDRGFSAGMARKFLGAGGDAVLFVCAQAGCPARAAGTVKLLSAIGVRGRVASAGNVGHTYDGPVAELVGRELAWLWATAPPAGAAP